MNPKVIPSPVRSMRQKTRDLVEPQLARISEEHGAKYEFKKVGGVIRVVVGGSGFPCLRVDLVQKKKLGTYLIVDGERVKELDANA